jgi:hypothetical protein
MAMIRSASLAEASAVRIGVLEASFLPAAFSAAVWPGPTILVLSAWNVPGHNSTVGWEAGVAGAVAGENLTGLPLPAAAFTLARSLGMLGLDLKEDGDKLAKERPKTK